MGKVVVYLSIGLVLLIGVFACVWWFSDIEWSYATFGDYLGGTLGSVAVLILIYTTWEQQKEIQKQNQRAEEEGIFRTYEVLYNDITGYSAQIISRAVRDGFYDGVSRKDANVNSYKTLYERMNAGDRGIFLRKIEDWAKKHECTKSLKDVSVNLKSEKIEEGKSRTIDAITGYNALCAFLFNGERESNKSIYEALRKTEVGRVYEILKDFGTK